MASTGCDICKPAVGSILASCWNQPIMDPSLVPLQDTNDTFMANMQKNGTYSVVPRIPGGEITADKLIVIGQVAKKYDLYTKITGGQRIDLFGAQLHELPLIWAELIAAGFETGHAYGKSTAYGEVLRRQHLVPLRRAGQRGHGPATSRTATRACARRTSSSSRVSGCTRECAEAQSKDVGVIATEKGWNLYVARQRRHAPAPCRAVRHRPRRRDPGPATSTAS